MKDIVDLLLKKNIISKKLNKIDNRLLKTRKKIDIYEGVLLNQNYVSIFVLKQKSRFLRKDIQPLEELYERLIEFVDHNFKTKILVYDMPFCSKAKEELKKSGWRLIDATS